jgi:hypothetical protein
MKNTLTIFILTFIISFAFTGCKEDFLEENPVNIIAPENLYVNKSGFETGLYGL